MSNKGQPGHASWPAEERRGRNRFSSTPSGLDEPDFEVRAVVPDDNEAADDSRSDADEIPLTARPGGDSQESGHGECYACPVGVAYGAFRGVRPETTDRLANAIADLIEAAASAFESLASDGRRARGRTQQVDIE